MKKLLTVLSALVLTSSAAIPASGFAINGSYKSESQKNAEFISEVTSFALRGAILNDQTVSIRNESETSGIDFDYATHYFGSLKIKDVLKDAFDKNQGLQPSNEDVVSTLYGPLFGKNEESDGPYDYTIRNSIDSGDLNTNQKQNVREGTNLYNLVKTKDWKKYEGHAPEVGTQSTISAVINGARIALGNDFSASLVSTLLDAATGGSVLLKIMGNEKTKNTIKNIMQKAEDLIDSYGPALNNAVLSLTQTNMTKGTLKDKLTESTNSLFEALIFITTNKDGKALEFDESADASKFGDASSRFWSHLLNLSKSSDPKAYGLKEVTTNLQNEGINQIAKIINFAMNLLHYYRLLDGYDKDISDNGSYLFDSKNKTKNGVIKEEVLKTDVLTDDNWWYKDGDNKYVKLNLQNLFSDISYFFSVNKNHSLRMINVLLGGVYNEDKKADELNPIMNVALTPLLNLVKNKAASVINIVVNALKVISPKVPILGNIGKALSDLFNDLPGQANQLLEWFATDGSDENNKSAVINLFSAFLNIAKSVFGKNKVEDEANSLIDTICDSDGLTNSQKTIAKIVISALQFIVNGDGSRLIDKPWTYMFEAKGGHSLLTDISDLAYFTNNSPSNKDNNIRQGLKDLQDLKNIFTMNFSDLLDTVSVFTGSKINIPDWLYESKDYSLATLTAWIAKNIFSTNGTNKLSQNQDYSITSEVFTSLVDSLLPHDQKQTDQIRITRKPVWMTSTPSCDNTNDPFLNNPVYDADKKTITIQTSNINDGDVKDKISGLGDNIASASVSSNVLTINLNNPLEQKDKAYGQNITYSDNGKSSSIAIFVPAKGKTNTENVSPVMALFYSLESFNSSVNGIDSLKLGDRLYWDYDIQLPDQDKAVPLIQNITSNKNVNPNALKWLLGLTTKDGNAAFAKNSLFQAISKLYGHNFSDGVEHPDMTAGARALFGLASAFSDFASGSVNEVIDEFYKPYLDEKNWKVTNVKYDNLFPKTANKDEHQWITYEIHFYNYTDKRWYVYNIKLERTPYDGTLVGWKVTKLYRQN